MQLTGSKHLYQAREPFTLIYIDKIRKYLPRQIMHQTQQGYPLFINCSFKNIHHF